MDLPNGRRSQRGEREVLELQLASSMPMIWALGMARASERKRARMSESAGGSRSPDSMDSNSPTFMAAPRNLTN
jgi:hypothetical protein